MLVGLTGTFGSGKSLVAGMMEEEGAAVVDADAIARRAVEPGSPALEEIRAAFGEEFLQADGRLDRRRMAESVFSSADKRRVLNGIVHPRVRAEMESAIARFRAEGRRLIVLNVPLLHEAGMTAMADLVAVVAVSEGRRFHRARRRDGISEREVVRRLAAQWPQRRKIAAADVVIDNSGPIEATRRQVRKLCEAWKESDPGPERSGKRP